MADIPISAEIPLSSSNVTASTSSDHSGQLRKPSAGIALMKLVLKACQTDDVSLISEALSIASPPNSQDGDIIEEVLDQAVYTSVRRAATKVLSYVLENGAKVPNGSVDTREDTDMSIPMLEILLAHGWDINARVFRDQPLLWRVSNDGDLVLWCLEHGATAIPKDLGLTSSQEFNEKTFFCLPILDLAAKHSTVKTFELLRSRGGELGRRALHFAARRAIDTGDLDRNRVAHPDMPDKDRAALYSERMAMVVHLVDTVGIDPNALDQPTGYIYGNHWGTPLCYLALSSGVDCTEVLTFLLQRGADPELVIQPHGWDSIEIARTHKNERFLEVVKNWKLQQGE